MTTNRLESITVTPSQLIQQIQACLAARVPLFVWGRAGIGKSSIIRYTVEQICKRPFDDQRLTTMESVDLRGLPAIQDGKTRWVTPDFFPTDPDSNLVILFDELNTASQDMAASTYQLFLDRRLGQYTLPKAVDLIAAGNREFDHAIVNRMGTALGTRFAHLNLEPDTEDWLNLFAIPNGINPMIRAFMRWKPAALCDDFDPASDERTQANPRTWDMLSRVIPHTPEGNKFPTYSGIIGTGRATEFLAFEKLHSELPDPRSVLDNPHNAPVPNEPGVLWALCSTLGQLTTRETFKSLAIYLERLPVDFGVVAMRDVVTEHQELRTTSTFINWVSKHQDVLM